MKCRGIFSLHFFLYAKIVAIFAKSVYNIIEYIYYETGEKL